MSAELEVSQAVGFISPYTKADFTKPICCSAGLGTATWHTNTDMRGLRDTETAISPGSNSQNLGLICSAANEFEAACRGVSCNTTDCVVIHLNDVIHQDKVCVNCDWYTVVFILTRSQSRPRNEILLESFCERYEQYTGGQCIKGYGPPCSVRRTHQPHTIARPWPYPVAQTHRQPTKVSFPALDQRSQTTVIPQCLVQCCHQNIKNLEYKQY